MCPASFAVADRAAGHVLGIRDLVCGLEFQALLDLVFRSDVGHVEDLVARPYVFFRCPVTIEAPLHKEGLRLIHEGHLVDRAVAGRAPDALPDVNLVIEIDEVR